MMFNDSDLQELAEEIEEKHGYDSVVICAGDSEENRVSYGFNRNEDQTFREIVGTVQTCLHLMMQDHFFGQYLSAYLQSGDEDES
jgi:hypothetical protein